MEIKTLAVATMLLSAPLSQASTYTYEIQQNWTYSDNATVYGSMAELYITVDNGNSSNQLQTYTWADITGLEVETNGTFSAIWDWPLHYFGGTLADTLFTTDATGNQANFLWNGDHYLNSNSGPFLQFGSGVYTNLNVSDKIQGHGHAYIQPWSGNTVGTLEGKVPEPASIALVASGLLGFGVVRRKKQQA
ncbi:MAG: PEP-CTERM sorting domain-containing protein [Methylococcaceae bacterium]|nr:PEP-CTERM sorting domain-containing protein [Methylococcaceae bacterium]